MRRKKMSVIAAVFAILFGLAQVAGASIPNWFVSTSSDSNIISVEFGDYGLTDGWYFGVYDGDTSSSQDLLQGGGASSANFSVTQPDTNWIITVTDGDFFGNTLNIENSDDFSFYFYDGSVYETDFSITALGDLNYAFSSNDGGGNVIGADLSAIPLPSSAIFLFSGFAGLVAFGSRKKIMK